MKQINKHYIQVKKLIRKSNLPESYFVGKYSFSPYYACQHACKYCDGRAEKYHVEGDFENDITIRQNSPDLLEKELLKLREVGPFRISSGVTDAYQPTEKKEKLTQRCAEILSEHHFPAGVLTKSSLILRDIDLWEKVHRKSQFVLMLSITLLDDKIRQIFEPNASPVEERLLTLSEFKQRGMVCCALLMPFIPYLTDQEKQITRLIEKLMELKIDVIYPGHLTLRPGKQKEGFFQVIKSHWPDLQPSFERLFANNRASGNPIYAYRQQFQQRLNRILSNYALPTLMPHSLYQNQFPLYDEIYILLIHMMQLYQARGIRIKRLEKSFQKYHDWLLAEKKIFNRRRSLYQSDLESKLLALFKNNQFAGLIDNSKLALFLSQIILERKIFDYQTLKLV